MNWEPDPPENLPTALYAVGSEVTTPWGRGTVCRVQNWAFQDRGRSYIVHHEFSSAPPNFGHCFGEADLTPAQRRPAQVMQEAAPAIELQQLEMFA
jgi:hypothetical protein